MKPTVFFSHSSLDKEPIRIIKEKLQEATGNTLDIFVSSDGASIPFGKNWLKEIEVALEVCKLMFVWVTPTSSQSKWIYFESGYAYSRGIHVVPIGFLGTKLEDLPAPLSFLQGFNITSAQSLNNIVAVINKEFSFTFPDVFDESFYISQVLNITEAGDAEILNHIEHLECPFYNNIRMTEEKSATLNPNWMTEFVSELEKRGDQFSIINNELYGVGYKAYDNKSKDDHNVTIFVDPLALNGLIEILRIAHEKAYGEDFRRIILRVLEKPNYKLPNDHFLISSRLKDTEVDFNTSMPNILYRFRNIDFRVNIREEPIRSTTYKKKELAILFDRDEKDDIPLLDLFKLLLRQNIYQVDNTGIE